MSDGPLLIVADCEEAAHHFAKVAGLGRDWRYVSRPDQVLGMRGGRFIMIATTRALTFHEIRQRLDAVDALKRAGFTELTG